MDKPFVLVADDDEATRTLLKALLHRDFIVDTANDGMDAIASLKRRPYAVIVVDLLMPVADGYAVLDHLRESQAELLERVVVLTASIGHRHMDRITSYAVGKVLAKPFEVDEFLAVIRECAGRGGEGRHPGGTLLSTGMVLLLADLLL